MSRRSAGVSGAPLDSNRPSLRSGARSASFSSSRRRNEVGTRKRLVARLCSTAAIKARGEYGGGFMITAPPLNRIDIAKVRPPPKYSGVADMYLCRPFSPRLIQCVMKRRRKCLCWISGPLGRPVVPEDSESSKGASPSEAKLSAARSPRARASQSASTVSTAISGASASPLSHSTSAAPKWRATRSFSGAVQRQSIGRMTKPARASP